MLFPPRTIVSFHAVPISAAANTANQQLVAAPGAGKAIWVLGFQGTADTGAGSISFQDEDDVAHSGVMPVAENGGFAVPPGSEPIMQVAANKALELDTVTCGFKGMLQYLIVEPWSEWAG